MTKVAFQMDHISTIDPQCDSTYMLMIEAQKRGFEIYHYVVDDLYLADGVLKAAVNKITLLPAQSEFFSLADKSIMALDEFDIVFIRQDPPFNMNYITNTYLLERLSDKVFFVNHPTAIRNAPEKLLACEFKEYMPQTLVSSNIDIIKDFAKDFSDIIIKPLYACGGADITKHTYPFADLNMAVQQLIAKYNTPIMVQRYLPEIKDGDLRVLICCGKVVGQVLRVPQDDNVAANFHAGGIAKAASLTTKQKEIIAVLSPILLARKLYFVGLDFIGDYLTEINVTSPTGIQEINCFSDKDISKDIWDLIITT